MNTAAIYYDPTELMENINNIDINEVENIDIVKNVDINTDIFQTDNDIVSEDEIKEYFDVDIKSIDASNNRIDRTSEKIIKRKKKQSEIDNELVNNFLENKTHDNFNKLWERFYFGIKGYAYKFMKDWDLAADFACQTFTKAWENIDKFDKDKAKFSTWLYTICKNLCLGEINKAKKDNYVPNDISDMFDSAMLMSSTALSTDSTQYTVEKGDIVANSAEDLIQRMYDTSLIEIDNLGGNYTKILKMKLIHDMKIREIADALNMNESTVKNYLYKGKENLEELMKSKHKSLYDMYLESSADEASKMI